MDIQKCNRGEVEFGINYENDMYGDVSVFVTILSLILSSKLVVYVCIYILFISDFFRIKCNFFTPLMTTMLLNTTL